MPEDTQDNWLRGWPLVPPETSNDELHIRDAFIALGSEPMRLAPGPGTLHNVHIYGIGEYVPRWARRPRLWRLRPYVRRFETARAAWSWSKGKRGASCAIYCSYPSDRRPASIPPEPPAGVSFQTAREARDEAKLTESGA